MKKIKIKEIKKLKSVLLTEKQRKQIKAGGGGDASGAKIPTGR